MATAFTDRFYEAHTHLQYLNIMVLSNFFHLQVNMV
jgi:hypothetical protein